MAEQSESQSHAVPATQPSPVFENYLKMVRFNTSESELLEKCLMPTESDNLLTSPDSAKILLEDSLHDDSLMEIDHEHLLQVRITRIICVYKL